MTLQMRARIHAALGDESRLRIVEALGLSDHTTTELSSITGLAGNLLAHHLNVLEHGDLIERRVSEGDKRRRYVVLRRATLKNLLVPTVIRARTILFICTHNSARSQFAAALWQQRTGGEAQSAGQFPAAQIHPTAIAVAKEHGIDLGASIPRGYDQIDRNPDLIISVCDRAREGTIDIQAPRLHWSVPDPVRPGSLAAFRRSFEIISDRMDQAGASKKENA